MIRRGLFTNGAALSAAGGYVPVYLPTHATAPNQVLSLYRLISAYSGPVALATRASDSTTLTISTSADNQTPDLSAVAAFLSGTTGVVQFYDQSPSALDPTIVVATGPQLILANAIGGKQPIAAGTSAVGTIGSFFMSLNAGLSNARTAVTQICALALGGGPFNSEGFFGLGTSATLGNNLSAIYDTTGNKSPLYVINQSFNSTVSVQTPSASQPIIYSIQSGVGALKTRLNGTSVSRTASTAITLTGGYLGRAPYSSGTVGPANIFAYVAYPADMADADVAADEAVLATVFSVKLTYTKTVYSDGDSIPCGLNIAGFLRNLQFDSIPSLTGNIYTPNFAIAGQTAAATYARRATTFAQAYNAGYTANVGFAWMGVNDIRALAVTFANTATSTATFLTGSNSAVVISAAGMNIGDGFIATGYPLNTRITNIVGTTITTDLNSTAPGTGVAVTTISYTTCASSASTIYTSYHLPYVQAGYTFGFSRMVLGTVIPDFFAGVASATSASTMAMELVRQALNTLITGGAVANNYSVADFASLTQLSNGTPQNQPNGTYYASDLVHPNAAGYALQAPLFIAAVNPYL